MLIKQLMDIRSDLCVNTEMRNYMFDADPTLQDFADMAAYLQALPIVGEIAMGPPEVVQRGNSNPAMPPILGSLSVDDKRAIAAYLSRLPPPGRL